MHCSVPVAAIHSQMHRVIWNSPGRSALDLTFPRIRLRIWIVRLPGVVETWFRSGPSPLLDNTVERRLLQERERDMERGSGKHGYILEDGGFGVILGVEHCHTQKA